MPLKKGTSKAAFDSNMHELMHSGKKRSIKQALAIAFSVKEKSGKKSEPKKSDKKAPDQGTPAKGKGKKMGMTIVVAIGNKKSK